MALPTQISQRLNALGWQSDEVEERFVRGTGPGGQKINKTSSTVWLRHGPTGIEVRCQRERSQAANRELAWAELCEKLEARARSAAAAVVEAREAERRRNRQKSRGQKVRMIQAKKHRAKHKSHRGRVGDWEEGPFARSAPKRGGPALGRGGRIGRTQRLLPRMVLALGPTLDVGAMEEDVLEFAGGVEGGLVVEVG